MTREEWQKNTCDILGISIGDDFWYTDNTFRLSMKGFVNCLNAYPQFTRFSNVKFLSCGRLIQGLNRVDVPFYFVLGHKPTFFVCSKEYEVLFSMFDNDLLEFARNFLL
jgi:hypothetical protein